MNPAYEINTSGFKSILSRVVASSLFILAMGTTIAGCTAKSDSQNPTSSSQTPTPTPSPTPTPTPTPTPNPTPSAGATSGSQVWHSSSQLTAAGDFGNLFYSPAGDAYVVYSTISGSDEDLDVVIRSGTGLFGSQIQVGATGRTSSMYFQSATDFLIASENDAGLYIYSSTDTGSSWSQAQSFAATVNSFYAAYLHSAFAVINNTLTLFFGYQTHGPLGNDPIVNYTTYSAGTWSTATQALLQGNTDVASVLASGANDILFGGYYGKVQLTTNAGSSYSVEQGPSGQNINWTSGLFQRASDQAIFTADASAGWTVWETTDFGMTWTPLVSSSTPAGATACQVAAIGSLIVTVAQNNSNQLYSMVSYDSGVTWNLPTLIVDLSGTSNIISTFALSASSSRIGLVFSEEDNSQDRLGVNFQEIY